MAITQINNKEDLTAFDDMSIDNDEDDIIDFGDSTTDNEEQAFNTEENTNVENFEADNNSSETADTSNNTSDNKKELQDLILYMIIDKPVIGMLTYFRQFGINISKIFNNIEDAKNELIMKVNPSRILIVDTGTGKFTSMSSRKELVDLLGICDEYTKIALFYTSNTIKYEAETTDGVDNKTIDWFKYRSTADIVANVLRFKDKENYVLDMPDKEVLDAKEVLNSRGFTVPDVDIKNLGMPMIGTDDIILNYGDNVAEENSIPGYEIRI